jgi:U3 small nucleolar RNA-associated protein 5
LHCPESSLARDQQAFSTFSTKLQGMNGPTFAHVLLAYESVVKPSFDKLLVSPGTDINLDISQDGVLLPNIQTTTPKKSKVHWLVSGSCYEQSNFAALLSIFNWNCK